MKILAIAILTAALCGCEGQEAKDLDGHVVCTTRGEAYLLRSDGGDVLFATRAPDADRVCAAMKPASGN